MQSYVCFTRDCCGAASSDRFSFIGVPHFYLPVRGSPAGGDQTSRLANLLAEDPHSWKPIAIIHSLGLSTGFSWQSATNSMDEWLTIADGSGRNTPYLWVGPNAAGHLKPPGKILQEGNNALWHYNIELGKEAIKRGVENLNLYNMTLQAASWDGSNYGEKVSVVQAMMVSFLLVFDSHLLEGADYRPCTARQLAGQA